MTSQSVTFTGARGQRLAGRLDLPADGPPRACAIVAHCFTCSKDVTAAAYVSRALAERRIAVLRFDFAGFGESEGDLAEASFAADVDDVVAASAFLERELAAPALLVGHSLGGVAVLAAASRIPGVRAVATIGAPADLTHIRNLLATDGPGGDDGGAGVMIAGRRVNVTGAFLGDMDGAAVRDRLRDLGAALVIFHAPDDKVVSIRNATRLYTAARHPKSFVSLPGAGHMLEERADAEYVASVLAAWTERYLPAEERDPAEPQRPTRVTAITGATGFRTEIGVRAHTLLADEPVAVGGTDAGPTPYDLLAAALGACTTMTLQMYARRKGWPLTEAIARLRHSRVYSQDQGDCPDRPARMDQLDRELELVGELTEEQRARLLEIADRCPVHLTLHAGVSIRTALAPPSGAATGAAGASARATHEPDA